MLIKSPTSAAKHSHVSSGRWNPALIIALLCLPSLLFVWHNRDVPHFGILQDDGVYLIDGKGIAEGSGYRLRSLPTQPFDTRYPPLYPLYLSLAWKIIPTFPANLPLAVILSWLALPVVLFFTYLWCRRHAFPPALQWLVVAAFALNPYVLFFVSNLVSEVFFMVFLLGAILAVERGQSTAGRGQFNGWQGPLLGGVIAGFAYLARTAGISLLPAAIAYYCWKKQPRKALWFALGMLPAVAGWTIWARLHAAPGRDMVTVAYTNYLQVYFVNVGWDNLGVILWHNVSSLLESLGSLVFPQLLHGILAKLILQPLGVAAILGCVRMARQGYAGMYTFFAASYVALLLTWPFQPNQRYILPIAPVVMAGFCFEMMHLARLFRGAFGHRDRSQRVVAYGFAAVLAVILAAGLGLQGYMGLSILPEMARNDRADTQTYANLYRWIRDHLPADASIVWENDTALYLNSGRHATNFVVPPRDYYATEEDAGVVDRYQRIHEFARKHGLGYFAIAKIGLQRNEDVLRAVASNPNLEHIYEDSGAILYRVRD